MASQLGVTVLLATVPGCSNEQADDTPSPRPSSAVTGRVDGTFRANGGPYPGVDEQLSGTITFDGPVTEKVAAPGGTFTLELPPGTYTVTGQPREGRFTPTTCPSATVTVMAEQSSAVEVSCVFE